MAIGIGLRDVRSICSYSFSFLFFRRSELLPMLGQHLHLELFRLSQQFFAFFGFPRSDQQPPEAEVGLPKLEMFRGVKIFAAFNRLAIIRYCRLIGFASLRI